MSDILAARPYRAVLLLALLMTAGCEWAGVGPREPEPGADIEAASGTKDVPHPIDLLLPHEVRIHPFTGRTFDEEGGIRGIEVRVEARDAYGDSTKAFGQFRFELYAWRPDRPDAQGGRVAAWTEDLFDARTNVKHWDMIAKRYQFRLLGERSIPVGRKYVLVVYFDSPFTERLRDEYVFMAGE